MDPVFGPIVMRPPVAPSGGIVAKRRAGNGMPSRVNEGLRRGLDRIVVAKIEQLRNGGSALPPPEHGRKRGGARPAVAKLLGRRGGQNGKEGISGIRRC